MVLCGGGVAELLFELAVWAELVLSVWESAFACLGDVVADGVFLCGGLGGVFGLLCGGE